MNFAAKPVFIGWITLLKQLPLQLFFTFWAGGFFGGIAVFTGLFQKDSRLPFLVAGAIAFFGIPATAYVGKKLNYARTEYRFYEDRLEFEEGFFNISKKVIKYRNIREVTLHKGLFQRIYGLGTIYVATEATGSGQWNNMFFGLGFGNVSASGVGVRDVREPEETFDKVRSLVDKHNDE